MKKRITRALQAVGAVVNMKEVAGGNEVDLGIRVDATKIDDLLALLNMGAETIEDDDNGDDGDADTDDTKASY